MQISKICFVVALLFSQSAFAFQAAETKPEQTKPEETYLPIHKSKVTLPIPEVTQEKIEIARRFSFQSKVLGTEREIVVWSPDLKHGKLDPTLPVLYVIDGGIDQDFHHISGLAQLATINGQYEELIVVGIKTENRLMELAHAPKDPRYIRSPPNAGKSDLFLKHITDEVFPIVDSYYPSNDERAVIGESLAGLFIAEVFLKHPKTFTHYICVSPSLWWDDQALGKSAAELLAKHDDSPRELYLTMASEGGTMQAGLDKIIAALKAKKPAGLNWQYVDRRKTESHSTIYHGAAHDALQKLFKLPQPEPDPNEETPWYLVEGGQPPEEEPVKD